MSNINLLCNLNGADNIPSISSTERFFLDSNRTVLSLVTLSNGLRDIDGSMILDPSTAPWKNMNSSMTKPKVDDLKAECICFIKMRVNGSITHNILCDLKPHPENEYNATTN